MILYYLQMVYVVILFILAFLVWSKTKVVNRIAYFSLAVLLIPAYFKRISSLLWYMQYSSAPLPHDLRDILFLLIWSIGIVSYILSLIIYLKKRMFAMVMMDISCFSIAVTMTLTIIKNIYT